MRIRIGFVVLNFLFFFVCVYGQNYTFESLNVESGLSQVTVTCSYQDELGMMWFGTKDGLNRFDGNEVKVFKPILGDTTSLTKANIRAITGDGEGNLYLQTQGAVIKFDMRKEVFKDLLKIGNGALGKGRNGIWIGVRNSLYCYSPGKDEMVLVREIKNTSFNCILESEDGVCWMGTNRGLLALDDKYTLRSFFTDSQVRAMYRDKNKNMWVCTNNRGLIKLAPTGDVTIFRHNPKDNKSIVSDFVRAICEDNLGNIWIGSQFGLCRLDINTSEFKTYVHSTENTGSLTSNSVVHLYKDRQGTIWIGTFFGGVNYFNPESQNFRFYPPEKGGLPYPVIGNFIEDKNGLIWICTEGGSYVTSFNPHTEQFTSYHLPGNNFKSVYYDANRHCLWLGTHLEYIVKFYIDTRKTEIIESSSSDISHFFGQHILALVPYKGKLLVGSTAGVMLYDPQDGTSMKFFQEISSLVTTMLVDSRKRLWIGTENEGLFCYDTESGNITSYKHKPGVQNNLSSNNINCILEDDKQRIWIGTNGYGLNLFLPESNDFKVFSKENSRLIDNTIVALAQSKSGKILVGTGNGLSICEVQNKFLVVNYPFNNGFPLTTINDKSLYVSREGDIFVGGINGMVILEETDFNYQQKPFDIQFSKLYVNNMEVKQGDKTGILSQALPYTSEIKIKPGYSVFSVAFSTDNYIYPSQEEIEYRLKGFESDWMTARFGRMLTYTNLNPGKYELELRLKNFPEITKTLFIDIIPPFYNTWYAYFFYVLVALGLIYWYIRQDKMRFYLKKSLEFEKKEKEKTEELTQSKLRFFTNISHEIRTPITLIIGQAESLLHSQNIHPSVYNKIINIHKNASNLSGLINELLDFRKQEQGHLKLKISEVNFVEFLKETFLTFYEYAQNNNISFKFCRSSDEINLWIDVEQMQKVINNLLSNAFKFTPPGGNVVISLEENESEVIFSISDNGQGILPDKIDHIFDRFYQADLTDNVPGTGIGLALTKGIIELHSGQIQVKSEVGKGTVFSVILKKGDTHFPEGTMRLEKKVDISDYKNSLPVEDVSELPQQNLSGEKDKLLIVEDNEDLRNFLKEIFSAIYDVEVAEDGIIGLEKVRSFLPDVVISDIMMPRMSGIELCSKIKNNFDTCHIPVILLTAKTALEHKFEGLRIGADDYISKPFNVKLLVLRCNNLVNSHRILQSKFVQQPDLIHQQQVATNAADKDFVEKATKIVEANLDKNEFDVNIFAMEMNLSRSSLFNKLKGVTGLTPNNFISNIRLKKAAEMLLNNPELKISDVAYTLNFSSPRYFNKCFKDLFGYAPADYRKSNKVQNE